MRTRQPQEIEKVKRSPGYHHQPPPSLCVAMVMLLCTTHPAPGLLQWKHSAV